MSERKGFSSLMYLLDGLTKQDKINCLSLLNENDILGYLYQEKIYTNFHDVYEKHPDRPRYLSKYKNLDFVVSCDVGNDFIILSIDPHIDYSKIIIKLTDEFNTLFKNTSFCYIDDEGTSPRSLEECIKSNDLKWLFKYNYFGKNFIEKYGKEFFLNMPCENVTLLTDDIIRIDLTKDIFTPIDKELAKKVHAYLKGFDIQVSFYNYKNFLID